MGILCHVTIYVVVYCNVPQLRSNSILPAHYSLLLPTRGWVQQVVRKPTLSYNPNNPSVSQSVSQGGQHCVWMDICTDDFTHSQDGRGEGLFCILLMAVIIIIIIKVQQWKLATTRRGDFGFHVREDSAVVVVVAASVLLLCSFLHEGHEINLRRRT